VHRIRRIAINAAKLTSAGFHQHESHWFAALFAGGRWRVLGHRIARAGSGGSTKLSVTDNCRSWDDDYPSCTLRLENSESIRNDRRAIRSGVSRSPLRVSENSPDAGLACTGTRVGPIKTQIQATGKRWQSEVLADTVPP